jgi:hypothetical protein
LGGIYNAQIVKSIKGTRIWILFFFISPIFSPIFLCVFLSHNFFSLIIICLFLIFLSSHSQNKELEMELERNQRRWSKSKVFNLLQYKTNYYIFWGQTRGSIHHMKKDKEEWRQERPLNYNKKMTLISSNNDEALGISPLKTTLFIIIQIHQIIANLIKWRTHFFFGLRWSDNPLK